MSKTIKERWNKLAFGSESLQSLNEATSSYPATAKEYQKQFVDWLRTLPDMPEKTAANEDILPSGESGGYQYEGLLKSALEKERQRRVGSSSKRGIAALDSPTLKFDLSIAKASGTGTGLQFKKDSDKTGTNNPDRFIKAEVKCLPAQFGQFKKAQLTALDFDGSSLTWTKDSSLPQDQKDFVDFFLNQVKGEVETFLTSFLEKVNTYFTGTEVADLLSGGFEKYIHSADNQGPEEAPTGVKGVKYRYRQSDNPAGTSVVFGPLTGALTSLNLKSDLYEQIGNAFSIGEVMKPSVSSSSASIVEPNDQVQSIEDQLSLDLSHRSLSGSLLREDSVQIPLGFKKDARAVDTGSSIKPKDQVTGKGEGAIGALSDLLSSQGGIGTGLAGFLFKGGDQSTRGAATSIGNISLSGVALDGNKWRDYMARTKDIFIFGLNDSEVKGYVFSLNPSFSSLAPQFSFPTPRGASGPSVGVTCRFQGGAFRFETQAPTGLTSAYLQSSGGIPYKNEADLYDILGSTSPNLTQDQQAEIDNMYDSSGKRKRSVNPNDPEMGTGSFRGIDQSTGKPIMDHRKHKYSITSKLLGE